MKRKKLSAIIKGTVVAVGIVAVSTYGNSIEAEAIGSLSEEGILRLDESVAVGSKNIIGNTSVSSEIMEKWARSKGATETFISLAKKYIDISSAHGNVNPLIAYAQAAVETGYGKFGGVLNESYFNPCGLKTREGGSNTDPNAHQRFASWDEGIGAHLDHLALYAGAEGYPRANTKDPRHFPSILGKAKTIEALSGTWATDTQYGVKITRLVNEIESLGGNIEPPKPVIPPKPEEPTPPQVVEKHGIVKASTLNVRQGAGTNTKVIGSLKRGTSINILETKNGWYKIKYGSSYGYVSAEYIDVANITGPETSNPTPPVVGSTKTGTVTANALNIRQGAGTNTKVIGSLRRGATVTILETKNGWHKIKHGSSYGYVSDDYVTVTGESTNIEIPNTGETRGTVLASVLNVRAGTGTHTKVVGSLKRGATVIILETKNGWHKIRYGNSYGYVSATYIRV